MLIALCTSKCNAVYHEVNRSFYELEIRRLLTTQLDVVELFFQLLFPYCYEQTPFYTGQGKLASG